jgi:predicted flap endonuclease-1-like 5' DNA nuclease
MTGFVLPSSWLPLSRTLKQALAQFKPARAGAPLVEETAVVEGRACDQSLVLPVPATLPLRELVQPTLGKTPALNRIKTFEVNLNQSDFASVFSLTNLSAKQATSLLRENIPDKETSRAECEAPRTQIPLATAELETMEQELLSLSSITAVLNVSGAQKAGFKLDERSQLRIIKGIGPKMLALLNEAGIYTFADLADCSESRIRHLLQARGALVHLARPVNWIRQAEFAALNQWDALRRLQATLSRPHKRS